MSKTAVCSACGADNAPAGARFCPNCGNSLSNSTAEEVPMAAATPLGDDPLAAAPVVNVESVLEPSTVTFDEPSSIPAASAPPNSSTTTNEATGTEDSQAGIHCANYFLNPTVEMIERAKSQAMGGVLFLETNDPKGKFTLAKDINVGRILGGNILDLSYADFVHPTTTITAGTVLGGFKVVVPRGVRVETKGIGILGAFQGLSGQTVHAAQQAPLVVIQGLAVLGGVHVTVNETAPPIRIVK